MKKLKFLPSALMLIMCIAVLGVGVFALSPVNNEINGTLTITSMAKVNITAYADDVEIFSSTKTASGVNMNLTESGALNFDAFNVATADEIPQRIIRIRIQNLSNKELGAYFYNGNESTLETLSDGTKLATYASLVHESKIYPQGADTSVVANSVADVLYSSYTYIAANDKADGGYDEVDMYITIDVTKIDYEDFVCDFACKLRIEEYRANVTGATYTANTYDLVKISSKVGEAARTTVPQISNDSKAGTVVMPTTITSLSSSNFFNCTALKHIIIPASVVDNNVAKWAFDSTPYLESMAFSNPGTVCSDDPFDMGIPMMFGNSYNYPAIDADGFEGPPIYPYWDDFYQIYTDSAPTYGSAESYYPKTLKTLYWNYSGDKVLFNGSLFYTDELPIEHIIIGNNVTTFSETFVKLANVKKITIPANVSTLNGHFKNLTNLTAVKFCASNMATDYTIIESPNAKFPTSVKTFEFGETVTSVPAYLCYQLTNLTSVKIPGGVRGISQSAFAGCTNLENIVISNGVLSLGLEFLSGTKIKTIFLPSSVSSMDDNAMVYGPFAGCSTLETIYVEAENAGGWFENWNMTNVDYDEFDGNVYTYADVKYGYTYEEYLAEIA